MNIEYLRDQDVDPAMDRALITLLSACFTGPDNAVFRHQRYFRELPQHRWIIRDEYEQVIAHVAVHDKVVTIAGQEVVIGGIAEVCVHPGYRGRGYVKALLRAAHAFLRRRGMAFAVLYGDEAVYGSSGYHRVHNLQLRSDRAEDQGRWVAVPAMVCPLDDAPWPQSLVRLEGQTF